MRKSSNGTERRKKGSGAAAERVRLRATRLLGSEEPFELAQPAPQARDPNP